MTITGALSNTRMQLRGEALTSSVFPRMPVGISGS